MEATFTVVLIILGFIAVLAGLIGCILPIVPGPPLGFLGLVLLDWAKGWEPFSGTFLFVMGVLTVLAVLLDYLVPAAGAKKSGATRLGIWGSMIGLPSCLANGPGTQAGISCAATPGQPQSSIAMSATPIMMVNREGHQAAHTALFHCMTEISLLLISGVPTA